MIGGSIVEGEFAEGDEIIIGPGRKIEKGNKATWEPIEAVVSSMQGGGLNLDTMHAGGLCGMATFLDPSITTADNLSGQVVARKGDLPEIHTAVSLTSASWTTWSLATVKCPRRFTPSQQRDAHAQRCHSHLGGVTRNAEKGRTDLDCAFPSAPTRDNAFRSAPHRFSLAPHRLRNHRVRPGHAARAHRCMRMGRLHRCQLEH